MMNGLTDFGAILGQMATIVNNFFVVHYITNKLCKNFPNQISSLNVFIFMARLGTQTNDT